MKKLSTLLVFSCWTLLAFGQTPFTITSGNFPEYSTQNFNGPNNFNGNKIIPVADGDWDLSSYNGPEIAVNDYQVETIPFYTQAGIDVYLSDFKNLNANLGYLLDYEIDFNLAGVFEKGIYVPQQAYTLGALTGNPLDSLTIPNQGAILSSGRQTMKFPATHTSSWSSQSRRVVDFNLSVTALGLNKTPCQHVFTVFRTDSIAGWGKLRVYANGSASVPYDVLIHKSAQYTVDSFFVGGAPAPPALLTAFGITQGQQTGLSFRYNAFREGLSTPLSILLFPNNNYLTPSALYFDTDNLLTSAVENPENLGYSTLLFPNPSSADFLNLQISGNIPALSHYEILDMQGRIVQSGATAPNATNLQLELNQQLSNGTYLLRILDDKKQTAITEQFVLSR